MPLLLALVSSMLLGSADFVAGLAARRARAAVVVVWSNSAGLVTALVLVLTLFPGRPRPTDLGWGALAGISGSLGAVLLYRALACGVMSLVAPTSAVAAAVIPVVAGLVTGERLTALGALGVLAALLSVVLISRGSVDRPPLSGTQRDGVVDAALAGVSFGVFLVLLAQTSTTSSLWPLVGARVAALAVLLGLLATQRRTLRMAPRAARYAWSAGTLDMASNVSYLVAVRGAELSTVGLLASLSPLGTVLLARLLLKERIRLVQGVGAALAMGSVILLAVGV